jgi:hypothetical protein
VTLVLLEAITSMGNKTKRDVGAHRVHAIRRNVDVEEAWKGLDVHTGEGVVMGGDSIMLP